MIKVFIDTSTRFIALGIVEDNKLVASTIETSKMNQSEMTLPRLDELLKANGYSPKDIEELVVTNGPGAFTGVRIGLVIAKTICATSNVKLKVISTLKALIPPTKEGISVIDARSKKVFISGYKQGQMFIEHQLVTIEQAKILSEGYDVYHDSYLLDKEEISNNIIENMVGYYHQLETVINTDTVEIEYLKGTH